MDTLDDYVISEDATYAVGGSDSSPHTWLAKYDENGIQVWLRDYDLGERRPLRRTLALDSARLSVTLDHGDSSFTFHVSALDGSS